MDKRKADSAEKRGQWMEQDPPGSEQEESKAQVEGCALAARPKGRTVYLWKSHQKIEGTCFLDKERDFFCLQGKEA